MGATLAGGLGIGLQHLRSCYWISTWGHWLAGRGEYASHPLRLLPEPRLADCLDLLSDRWLGATVQ
jgi:hypothetical protein